MDTTVAATYERLLAHVEPAGSRRLLLAALEVFAARGFAVATTREICQRAGMSQAGLYVHYESKVEVLQEIIRVGHEAVLDEALLAVEGLTDHRVRVRAFTVTFAAWHARFHTLARVAQYEMAALPPERLTEIFRLRREFERFVETELREGEEAGEFHVVDLRGTVVAILSLGMDVARWYSPEHSPEPEEIGELYGELVLRMLSPSAGP